MADDCLANLLERWRGGDQDAAAEIYRRFERRVRRMASRTVGPGLRPLVGSESVMLHVMNEMLYGIQQRGYALDQSSQFMALAKRIGENYVCTLGKHHTAEKRDIRRMVRPAGGDRLPEPAVADEFVEAAAVADECERARRILPDNLFQVFQFDLDGYSPSEIGERLGVTRHTITRWKKRIWEILAQPDGQPPQS